MLLHDLTSKEHAAAIPHCEGAGELTEYLSRDRFGNWDTREWPCPGCPNCATAAEQERAA